MKWQLFVPLVFFVLCSHAQNSKWATADSLKHLYETAKSDTQRIRILHKLIKVYQFVYPEKQRSYLDTGLALAQKVNSDSDICFFFIYQGENFLDAGDFKKGVDILHRLYNLANKDNDKKMMALALSDLGEAYELQGDYSTAQDYFFKCLPYAEQTNNQGLMAICNVNISAVYLNQNDFDKTIEYAKKTFNYTQNHHNGDIETKALELLGSAAIQQKRYAQAMQYYNQSLKIYQGNKNRFGEASIYTLMGQAFPGDYKQQLAYGLKAMAIWDSIEPGNLYAINNLGNIGTAYGAMARLNIKGIKGNGESTALLFNKAEQYLSKAIQLANKTGSKQNIMEFTDSLAVIQAAFGKYKDAYNNLQTHNSIYDSIFSQDNKNKIANLEGKHEIALRDKQLEINKLELVNQQKQRWILIGGVVLLMLIAGLIYNQSRLRKKANLTLLQLNNQLDEANKVKTKFFNIINHDLRGPVAGFINLLHLQQNDSDLVDEIKQREYIAKAAASAENLLETMEDLLLWSKGQMENFKPHIKLVTVESLFSYLQKSTPAKTNIVISFQQQQVMELHTDEHYIKTIMHNLTNNAIKALGTQPDGTIEWRGWQEGAVKFLAIKDNGPGATAEQLRPLYDETATVGIKNGLGLHIVRDMARVIGCKVLVNTKLGDGVEIQLVFG